MNLHHVGYVVRDAEAYAASFPGLRLHKAADDPLQSARLFLYESGGRYIELVQPTGPEAFTWRHLERHGEGLHHVCYDGVDPAGVDALIAQHKMLKIRGPMHAVLFDRPVLFAMTRHKALVEFLL